MNTAALKHWAGWAALMLVTGLISAVLRSLIGPLLPAGHLSQPLSALFVVVAWPSLTWSLRAIGQWCRRNTLDAVYVVALLWW